MGLLDDEFLTVAEVAELLKLNQQTVRNWIDRNYLPAIHVGRRVRIRRADLEQLLKQSEIKPRPRGEPASKDGQNFWEGGIPPLPAPDQG